MADNNNPSSKRTGSNPCLVLSNVSAWPNLLGLDSPMVAVCWQAMFAKVVGVELPWIIYLILGLSTWCIYLADRLYDVTRYEGTVETSRHEFTRKNLRILWCVLIMISIGNAFLIYRYIPCRLFVSGLFTLGWIAMYYVIRLSRLKYFISVIPRECMCGMLFAAGCAIAPQAYAGTPWEESPVLIATLLMYGMVCSASCVMISVSETAADKAALDPSIVVTHQRLLNYLPSMLMTLSVLSFFLAWILPWQALIPIGLSAILLGLTYRYQHRLSLLQTRVLADAVLLTPLLFLGF